MTAIGADTIIAAFRRLGEGPADESTTLGDLVTRLDARAHALVLLLLAAPNLTPGPSMPGFSTIFALPLCVVAFEMMLGRRRLRLPGFLARIQIRRGRIAGLVGRLEPLLHRVERVLRPRGPGLAGPGSERPLQNAKDTVNSCIELRSLQQSKLSEYLKSGFHAGGLGSRAIPGFS